MFHLVITVGETEAQGASGIGARCHSWQVLELGLQAATPPTCGVTWHLWGTCVSLSLTPCDLLVSLSFPWPLALSVSVSLTVSEALSVSALPRSLSVSQSGSPRAPYRGSLRGSFLSAGFPAVPQHLEQRLADGALDKYFLS